jgi:hypothetical protein
MDSAPSTESEVSIDPAATVKIGGFAEPIVACDVDSSRFFYASSGLGYMVALDSQGRELWRADVPGFSSIVPSLEKLGRPTVDQVITLLDSSGSLVTKLIVSGAYVLVEVRTADRYFDSVFHRSGAFIGTVGPWNAVVLGPVDGGWRLSYTSDNRPDEYFFPDREVTLTINDDTVGPLADHMIAAVTPAETADGYKWNLCPGVAGLGDILGERWRSDLAKTAVHVRDSLGTAWIGEMAKRVGRPGALEMRRALLAAGVDVEMIKAWRAAVLRASPNAGAAAH